MEMNKSTPILVILVLVVGYMLMSQNGLSVVVNRQPVAPSVINTQGDVITVPTITPLPTWTPQSIDFNATATAFFTELQSVATPQAIVPPTRPFLQDLPPMGPYTEEQRDTCFAIWDQGIDNELPSPQYELCKVFIDQGK
jgi:hypothetical protein